MTTITTTARLHNNNSKVLWRRDLLLLLFCCCDLKFLGCDLKFWTRIRTMAHQMSMTEEQLKDWRMPQLKELVKQLIVQKNNKKCAKKTHCAMIRTQRSKHTRLSLLSGCCCVVVVKVTVLVNSYTLTSLHYPLCLLGRCVVLLLLLLLLLSLLLLLLLSFKF